MKVKFIDAGFTGERGRICAESGFTKIHFHDRNAELAASFFEEKGVNEYDYDRGHELCGKSVFFAKTIYWNGNQYGHMEAYLSIPLPELKKLTNITS